MDVRQERKERKKKRKKRKEENARKKRRKRRTGEEVVDGSNRQGAKAAARLFAAIRRCGCGPADPSLIADVRYHAARLSHTVVVDDSGRTPLQRAVLEDNAQVCRLLIDVLGSDTINMVAGSEDASTALHYSCLSENAEICYLLWKHGAETGIKNSLGITAEEMGFERLRKAGEQAETERRQRKGEWDERMSTRGSEERERSPEELNQGTRSVNTESERRTGKEQSMDEDEEDFHVFDYTEGASGFNRTSRRGQHRKASNRDAFERWKEMERNKWRRMQEESEWAERLQEEFEGGEGYLGQWQDDQQMDEEQWKDWVRREMDRKASQRWGNDHEDFYDAKARKQRKREQKERERREKEEKLRNKARIEQEEREKEAKREAAMVEKRKLDWKRLESAWTAFEELLSAEDRDLGLTDIPFPDIEDDEETGHTFGGFDFVSRETTMEAKAKYLRTVFLRWHPDKFEQRVGKRILPDEKEAVMARVTRITQHITRLKDLLAHQLAQPP